MVVYFHAGYLQKSYVADRLKCRHGILSPEFFKNKHGKPYLKDNPLYFNLSHSKDRATLAVSNQEVGIDVEKLTPRRYETILSNFSQRERDEICSLCDFLLHWTVRESFVKYRGSSIAKEWKCLEYFEGKLFLNGKEQPVFFKSFLKEDCVFTVCAGKEEEIVLVSE